MAVDLTVPSVGESISEVLINRWLKSEGDAVEKDETVAELETDKATFELPAPASGTISRIGKKQGETANVGEVIGAIEEGAAAGNGKPAESKQSQKAKKKTTRDREQREDQDKDQAEDKDREAKSSEQADDVKEEKTQPEPEINVESVPRLMPAAKRALAEHGLTADQVEATGPGGRLLKEDVIRHVAEFRSDAEARRSGSVTGEAREEEVVAMSPMRKTIARRLVEAQQTAALLTTFNDVDMSGVMSLRKKYKDAFAEQYDTKLGFMSFFLKAAVDALRRFPALNAEIREGSKIVYRNYFDIGIAVSTPKGLTVPVVRSAEALSFAEIEQQVLDYAKRGQENKIELKELEGGTFTITNGGVFGSLLSTPIVNPPQSGVLGMHAIEDRVVAVDGQPVVRPMMYIALTYDHRIVDGREAVSFLKRIKECIEDPTRMLMEV